MKMTFFLSLTAGLVFSSFAGQYSLTNDTSNSIVGVFIRETGSIDFLAAPAAPEMEVENVFYAIDSLGPEDAIFIGFDFEPDLVAENMPMAVAGLRHAFGRHIPVFVTSLTPPGNGLIEQGFAFVTDPGEDFYYQTVRWLEWEELREVGILTRTALVEAWEEMGNDLSENALGWIFEGQDYVILGWLPAFHLVILGMCDSIEDLYPDDLFGNPLDDMPMVIEHSNLGEINLVLTVSGSSACLYWLTCGSERIGLPVAFAVTSIMASTFREYSCSDKFIGLISGLQGAAEYEFLLQEHGVYSSTGKAFQDICEDHAVRTADWGANFLGEGEVITPNSTKDFHVGNGHYDIWLIDNRGWLWLDREVPVFESSESGIREAYRMFTPSIPTGVQ